MAEGLDAARRYQFVSYRGAREGSNKVVIVIMEGESSDIAKTLTAASLLKVYTWPKNTAYKTYIGVYHQSLANDLPQFER